MHEEQTTGSAPRARFKLVGGSQGGVGMTSSRAPASIAVDAVRVSELGFGYDSDTVVSVDHFALAQGASCLVLGPSGCGKTSFVHLLAGLLAPQSGRIEILGQDLTALSEAQRDRFRGRHIGFVFQRLYLVPALTVRENLLLALRLSRAGTDHQRVDSLLARLGLDGLAGRKPGGLSQGQAQRVAIARALVHSPALLIADEPTSALDDKHTADVLELLLQASADAGTALLLVTHDHRLRGRLHKELVMGEPA